MGLARSLVELERELRKRTDIDLFAPTSREVLLSLPESASVVGAMRASQPADTLRLCLQALRVQHAEMVPGLLDAELVATLPPGTPGAARPTERVVHEMIMRAGREIILLGYELTDRALVQALADASSRGSSVFMICDRIRGAAERVREAWPPGTRTPRLFRDRERAGGAVYASMHAKCLLVDGVDLLITSANFTFHGLRGNIEIGVRINGAAAAEARKIFSHLVEAGIVEEVGPGADE